MRNKRISLFFIVAVIVPLVSACGGLSSQQQTSANEALKALKKVQAATQVGVNSSQYGQLVIEAQAAVNDASSKLPDGELKKELQAAIEAYGDAPDAWSKYDTVNLSFGEVKLLRLKDFSGRKLPAQRLREKYNIRTFFEDHMGDRKEVTLGDRSFQTSELIGGVMDGLDRDKTLNTIWKEAEKHLERASSLLQK
jgi:phage gp46-like protein